VISEDLDELFTLADRFLVAHAGEITDAGPSETLDRRTVGLLMAGQAHDAASHAPVPA
jgi:general nucleoside transport system ATP-binding protein